MSQIPGMTLQLWGVLWLEVAEKRATFDDAAALVGSSNDRDDENIVSSTKIDWANCLPSIADT